MFDEHRRIEHRNQKAQPWVGDRLELAEPEDDHLLPLRDDLHARPKEKAYDEAARERHAERRGVLRVCRHDGSDDASREHGEEKEEGRDRCGGAHERGETTQE